MGTIAIGTLALLVAVSQTTAAKSPGPLADPWQGEYSAAEAKAPHVLALWQFNGDSPLNDASGRGHKLELLGAQIISDGGKFGGGLRSFPGWPVEDKRHAAVAKAHPSLSPSGPFTIDLWLKPASDMPARGTAHLLCKKYVSHFDYQLSLSPLQGKTRRLQIALGFGADSEVFASDSVEWPADAWQHVAVTYDGEGGVRFYRNGATLGGRTSPGRKAISAGPLPLTIGDRSGSNYGGFSGVLDQVRISSGVREFSPVSLELAVPRSSYVRMEASPTVKVTVRNLRPSPLAGAKLTVTGLGAARSFDVPQLDGGATHETAITFDTTSRPDLYEIRARVDVSGESPTHREESRRIALVARPTPHRMPVMMWGVGSPTEFARELPRLRELGFNQCLGFGGDYDAVWKSKRPIELETQSARDQATAVRGMLDTALADDFGIAATLYAGAYLKEKSELSRVDLQGKPYARRDVNAALPGLVEFCENVGKSVGRAYGDHPALVAALINSEVRDDSEISFSDFDREAYRKFSGAEMPSDVTTKYGVAWKTIKDFPADRVIPDDDPRLKFLRWFWTDGDGWNSLHSALHRGLRSELRHAGKDSFYTWFDPTIRTAAAPGSGGEVDVLSQWTYTEPSPLRVGYFADELFAMARVSARPQRVMKMTQLFWYRSTSAPLKTGADFIASPFDDHDPDAAYISIAPMHLRGAFWSMVSRPVSGVMYHGWSSLVPTDGTHAYKFTQPDLQTEFRRLHREVLPPLAPLLLNSPAARTDVAYLESFTSQMFARRGSFGYSHDEAYLTLLHAQLQPEVIYEDTLLKDGLDAYRVLVLCDCDVLTASVAAKIREFQRRGGVIIGDPNLAPAIKADVVMPKFTRTKKVAEDKQTLLRNAAELRKALDSLYVRPVESTEPELVVRRRAAGAGGELVFAINDRREAGTYVGQHGLVQEVGLPSSGEIVYRPRQAESGAAPKNAATGGSAAAKTATGANETGRPADLSAWRVYDLTAQREVQVEVRDGALRWPVSVGPCDGAVWLVIARPLAALHAAAPEQARLGESITCRFAATDERRKPLDAVIPLHVEITDPHGRPAEFSGYHAAIHGRLDLKLDIASNDTPGVWTVRAKELATGQTSAKFIRVLATK